MDLSFRKFWRVIAVVSFIIALSSSIGVGQERNYQALSLEDCLYLAKQYNPVLAGSLERFRSWWRITRRPVPNFFRD